MNGPDYSSMTSDEFRGILVELVAGMTAEQILAHGEVYAYLSKELNNEVLSEWERRYPERAFPEAEMLFAEDEPIMLALCEQGELNGKWHAIEASGHIDRRGTLPMFVNICDQEPANGAVGHLRKADGGRRADSFCPECYIELMERDLVISEMVPAADAQEGDSEQ